LKEHRPLVPWITIDLIKKGLKKAIGGSNTTITTNISDLTESTASNISPAAEVGPTNSPLPPPATEDSTSSNATSKKGGRPRGTTLKSKREKSIKAEELVNDITTEWMKVKKENEERAKPHTLDDLIAQKKKEYSLEDLVITKDCIRKRITRKRLFCARHPGAPSPMKPVEEYLVSIFNQMAKMAIT